MIPRSILFFLLVSALFALTHFFAVETALYWYYPWFDIVMHFWGGVLVVFGVYTLSQLSFVPLKPNALTIFTILFLIMAAWEIFERSAGLYLDATYIFDTTTDIVVGTLGGMVGYFILKLRKINI